MVITIAQLWLIRFELGLVAGTIADDLSKIKPEAHLPTGVAASSGCIEISNQRLEKECNA
ncbi:MAG: hypothetical protein ACAF41_17425 [Leptolyngbya sp. BL-A-14]